MKITDLKSVTIHGMECATCGARHLNLGTMRCDRCWEVERRLADYLRAGGARALEFMIATVDSIPEES